MIKLPLQEVNCDLLCIGGGPAGLMAAIRASELGSSVIVAEKSNTRGSGSGSAGNDHIKCYIPEVHGQDPGPARDEFLHAPVGPGRSDLAQTWVERSFEIVKLWDSWGIPMQYEGHWEFAGHSFPGKPRIHMKYTGGNQKQVWTKQALRRKVRIMNRVTVFELLKDKDRIVGALGYDTWHDRVIVFRAKAVFLGTGGVSRLYPSSTPGWMFNVPFWPFNTGDGRAMVYRIGGELCDLELTSQWAGPKYFSRAGKSTWIGVLRDPDDKPVGPFITKPDKIFGDITSDAWTTVFDDYMQSGRGPVFMDCRGASPEDLEYMVHWLRQEGNTGLLDHMAEEGIDPGKNPVEFRTYEIGLRGGVWWNVKSETSLKGLYSTGDEFGTGMTSAAIWGWIAGESAAEYIKTVEFSKPVTNKDEIDEKVGVLEDILNRRDGATWKEANIALQNIVREYCGLVRSETLLEQGLKNLGRLKKKVYETISAGNGHELGRSLEVLNLMDTAEALMLCARERKETRGRHNRADYPFTNPLLNKKLFIKKKKDKPVFEWKERGK